MLSDEHIGLCDVTARLLKRGTLKAPRMRRGAWHASIRLDGGKTRRAVGVSPSDCLMNLHLITLPRTRVRR